MNAASSVCNRFPRSAGQYTDTETGYQYRRARYYDPGTGVFLTRDPIEVQTREPYGYVGGNPLNRVDPLGLCWGPGCWVEDAWDATGGKAVTWAADNSGTAATIGAIGVCLTPGVNLALCGAASAGAFGVRSGERIADQGFGASLSQNLVDGVLTYATFGLVTAPGYGSFGGLNGVVPAGQRGIMDGASGLVRAFARGSYALPDLAGLFGGWLAAC